MSRARQRAWLLLAAGILSAGFTLSPAIVPVEDIVAGGPAKDGIPALTHPRMETAQQASLWLDDADAVLGLVIDGQARAYPLRILNWHEIVNDRIGERDVVVSYCPLCGSGLAFDTPDTFGVSGLLYQSDVLLYDHKSQSLWSQIMMQAVAGPRAGERLKPLPLSHTHWGAWRARHPESLVLSRHTGHQRDYGRNPYAGYGQSDEVWFPLSHVDARLPAKTWVVGVVVNGKARAWPVALIRAGKQLDERWQGIPMRLAMEDGIVVVRRMDTGEEVVHVQLYWFAWAAFHPDTSLASR